MDSVLYARLSRVCSSKEHNKEQAEDLLHDSILLALEKNRSAPGYIINTFKYKRREAARDLFYQTKIYQEYIEANIMHSLPIEGKALDYNKALIKLQKFLKFKFRYSHLNPSKRVESFLRMCVYKQSSVEIAPEINSSPASVRNMACEVRDIVKSTPRLKDVVETLELYFDV